MGLRTQKIVALAVGISSAVVLVASAGLLVADYLAARRQEPIDRQRVQTLEQMIKKDASHGPELTAEYERQTEQSLERAARQKTHTRILTVGVVLFLLCAKWLVSLGGPRPPALATIAEERTAGPQALGGQVRLSSAAPPGQEAEDDRIDLSFVDTLVAERGRTTEAAIPILQAIQTHYRYLPDEALQRVCELTEISPAQIAGVSSFYAQFRRSPVGKYIIKVCHGTACHVSGAREITDEIRRHLEIASDADTDPQRMFTVDEVACLGCCSLAPVIMVDDETAGKLTPISACGAIAAFAQEQDR